jgi:hypothetical protein
MFLLQAERRRLRARGGGLGLLVLRSGRASALQRLAGAACAAFGLAVAALFGFSLLSFETAIFTLPWLALGLGPRATAGAARAPQPLVRDRRGRGARHRFALPTLPWLVWLKLKMRTSEFLREVLLIGGDVQQVYAIPYPLPEWWALALAVGLVASAVVPLALGRGVGTRRGIAWSAAVVAGIAALAFALFARMPEGLVLSIIWQLENAAFYLVPLSLGAAVWWLVRTEGAEAGAPALVIVSGLAMLEQMNPRPDFMHLVMAVPVGVAVVAFVGARVAANWRRVGGIGRVVSVALLGIPFVVGGFRLGSNLGRPVGMDRVTGAGRLRRRGVGGAGPRVAGTGGRVHRRADAGGRAGLRLPGDGGRQLPHRTPEPGAARLLLPRPARALGGGARGSRS